MGNIATKPNKGGIGGAPGGATGGGNNASNSSGGSSGVTGGANGSGVALNGRRVREVLKLSLVCYIHL